MKRRQLIKAGGLLSLAGAFPAFFQRALAAWPAAFKEKQLSGAMMSYFGADAYEKSDAVKFKTPEIAENGAVVPVTVEYDGDAEKVAVFVESNPQPLAAAFDLSPKSAANVSTRIKMGKSSNAHAVVKTKDGRLLGIANEIKVTIGGCGG